MIKSCSLITPIAPSYLRNNRSTRQKSLRCFPTCSPKGHIMGGFCGQSLRATMCLDAEAFQNRRIDVNDFVFICEIRPSDEPRISSEVIIRKSAVMDKVRSKQDKDIGKELFMGEVVSCLQQDHGLELEIIFNGRHHSWDYSWKSNRWSEQQHVVDIIILSYESSLDFRVAGVFTSSHFMILSSHKKSTKDEKPSRQVMVTDVISPRLNKPAAVANIAAAAAASSTNPDVTDQDLLDASNALSMLAGGGSSSGPSDSVRVGTTEEPQERLPSRTHPFVLSSTSHVPSLHPQSLPTSEMVLLPRAKSGSIHIPDVEPMFIARAGSYSANKGVINAVHSLRDTVSNQNNKLVIPPAKNGNATASHSESRNGGDSSMIMLPFKRKVQELTSIHYSDIGNASLVNGSSSAPEHRIGHPEFDNLYSQSEDETSNGLSNQPNSLYQFPPLFQSTTGNELQDSLMLMPLNKKAKLQ